MQYLSGHKLILRPQRTSRLVQVEFIPAEQTSCRWVEATTFRIGVCDWCLEISYLNSIALYPHQVSSATTATHSLPTASFTIRLLVRGSSYPIFTDTAMDVKFERSTSRPYTKSFTRDIMVPKEGFIVEVEFHDLKVPSSHDEKPRSIWTTSSSITSLIQAQALPDISKMLDNEIHTDVTITTSDDGIVRAHRAILASRSKVFDKMFTHKMKETLSSTVPLTDMTQKECWALLKYMYGGLLEQKDIEEHAKALLKASMKYDLAGLKEVCQTSLLEGINATNVLTSLRFASDYQLQELKEECKRYLLDFGKVWQIKGEVSEFIRESNKEADDEIGMELVKELIDRMSLHACVQKKSVHRDCDFMSILFNKQRVMGS